MSSLLLLFSVYAFAVTLASGSNNDNVQLATEKRELSGNQGQAHRVSSNPSDIKFYFYRNPEKDEERSEIQIHNNESLIESGYNRSRPLIVLLHGVLSTFLTNSDVQLVKNAYLRKNFEANIVMVDYGPLTVSRLPLVLSPAAFFVLLMGHGNTEVIASRVEEFLHFLISYKVLDGPQKVHIIGFSLGSHIAGNVGKRMWESSGLKIQRITGLDPSPQMLTQHNLSPADADFVDVTLTSLGYLTDLRTSGHVQFFMNGGGPHQPNCPYFLPVTETYCSHITAPFYYSKSITRSTPVYACPCIKPCKIVMSNCTKPVVYGENTPITTRGNFYVQIE